MAEYGKEYFYTNLRHTAKNQYLRILRVHSFSSKYTQPRYTPWAHQQPPLTQHQVRKHEPKTEGNFGTKIDLF
jgi:hypothetical protein